jgi:hypothetical protein
MTDSYEKGVISRDSVVKCRWLYINGETVSVDGEVMGYIQKLFITAKKPHQVTIERTLPVKNGFKIGTNFKKVIQTIIVEKK